MSIIKLFESLLQTFRCRILPRRAQQEMHSDTCIPAHNYLHLSAALTPVYLTRSLQIKRKGQYAHTRSQTNIAINVRALPVLPSQIKASTDESPEENITRGHICYV